jgi:hypothetical protein
VGVGFGSEGFICHLMTLSFRANLGQLVIVRSLFATCSRDDYSTVSLRSMTGARFLYSISFEGRDTRVRYLPYLLMKHDPVQAGA